MIKKLLLAVVAIVLVIVGLIAFVFFSTFSGLKEKNDTVFKDGAIPIVDGYVQAYAIPIDDAGHAIVIDCGNEGNAVATALAAHKLTPVAIFITHGHPDHVGGCSAVVALAAAGTKIPVYAGAPDIDLIEGRAAAQGPLPKMFGLKDSGTRVTNPLSKQAESVDVNGVKVQAIANEGHTAGSTVYAVKHTLYFGDAATGGADGKVIGAPWLFSDDTALADASVKILSEKLKALKVDTDIDTYAFAHSGSLPANPALLIGDLR